MSGLISTQIYSFHCHREIIESSQDFPAAHAVIGRLHDGPYGQLWIVTECPNAAKT